jgi:hypothetical protein
MPTNVRTASMVDRTDGARILRAANRVKLRRDALDMFGDGPIEERNAEAVKIHVELMVIGDQRALSRRDAFLLRRLVTPTDRCVLAYFPDEQDLRDGQ